MTPVHVGLFGKIPSRADFVRFGLPGVVTQAWDGWVSAALVGSQSVMGAAWRPAWMQAPVWRFALPAGLCGPLALLGLWLPSTDRIGRLFPLLLAATREDASPTLLAEAGTTWLDAAEAAGRAALADDLEPDELAARLLREPTAALETLPQHSNAPDEAGVWWTDGGPLVAAHRMTLAMPDAAMFARMLGCRETTAEAI